MAEEKIVDLDINAPGRARIAAYLRCFPFDTWGMDLHRSALRRYAGELGLPEPRFYLDNGVRSRGPLPSLGRLMELVACDAYDVLLVPGPFVFSMHDREASAIVGRITGLGCTVLELPPLHAAGNRGPEPSDPVALPPACAAVAPCPRDGGPLSHGPASGGDPGSATTASRSTPLSAVRRETGRITVAFQPLTDHFSAMCNVTRHIARSV
ncbi:hypothetical protein J7E88_32520 [Streptomyces sp. ISL-10]|uniref:hypothetical protein n=1 Tax=Streptomyces sp. ISL-10 TaxID=2819172 RepID=UPI001BEAAC46|nr:hypothetical protein [Streptomyces sp. ISL-10]MBT2369871.1 hypothetical protein [Streptomyces sp. ISL-10]